MPLTAAHAQGGTILPIPQAGLATTEEKIKTGRHEIIEILKATIEGLDYAWSQREGTSEIIAKWMNLKPAQAAIVYDSVRETFSKNGMPTEEQAKAYITMLGSTAGLKGDLPAAAIFDFSPPAEAAKELAAREIRIAAHRKIQRNYTMPKDARRKKLPNNGRRIARRE